MADKVGYRDLLDALPSSAEVRGWLAVSIREADILRRLLKVIEGAERDLKRGDACVPPSPKSFVGSLNIGVIQAHLAELRLEQKSLEALVPAAKAKRKEELRYGSVPRKKAQAAERAKRYRVRKKTKAKK